MSLITNYIKVGGFWRLTGFVLGPVVGAVGQGVVGVGGAGSSVIEVDKERDGVR